MRNDVAILLQGAVSCNTEKIIDYYQSYNCPIILSTYINSINFDIMKYKNLSICTIALPNRSGFGNRNYQRYSTFNGLELAKKMNMQYVLKSRTDHFFKHPNLIDILQNNIKLFTLHNCKGQKERIIVPNGGTTLNQVWGGSFHISDHWLFGTVDDLYNYFDINNIYWDPSKDFQFNPITATEIEFCRLWMMKQKIQYNTTSELLKDRFIVLDNQSLYYDQVKLRNDNIMSVRTNWTAWCDPLTVHSRLWFQFYIDKAYTLEQELEINKYGNIPY